MNIQFIFHQLTSKYSKVSQIVDHYDIFKGTNKLEFFVIFIP